jgi:hypothetical protein
MPDRLLVNFFYAHPVGHAIEALHYANGYHAADPELEIAVALNAATPVELASYCPFVAAAYAIQHPFLERASDGAGALDAVPRDWTWIVDDGRRHQPFQLELFAGMRDYYAASDRHLVAERKRGYTGGSPPPYRAHQPLRLALPGAARAAAERRLGDERPRIALMPAGSSDRALYPSTRSWLLILDALADAFPGVRIALVGKRAADGRTTTALAAGEHAALLAHRSRPVDCFDIGLAEQLAVVEASDVFLAPHTGFGLAALAVGTPWLALSGGRWFEYYFNHVPFRSILPDVERYPSATQFAAPAVEPGEEGPRTPSMTERRVRDDLDRIVAAAGELISGLLPYERALDEYVAALVAAHGGDASQIWSIDGVHLAHLPGAA